MNEPIQIPDDIDIDTLWYVVDGITRQVGNRGKEILKEKLEAEGLDLTGNLISSLKSEVQNANGWSTNLVVNFLTYGRFKDMKYTGGSNALPGRAYVENMVKFVTAVMDGKIRNSTPFSHISGRVSFPADRQKTINSLAWALARGRLKSVVNERNKKGWYIRNYMKEIYGEIEANIQAAAAQAVLNTMTKVFKDKQ